MASIESSTDEAESAGGRGAGACERRHRVLHGLAPADVGHTRRVDRPPQPCIRRCDPRRVDFPAGREITAEHRSTISVAAQICAIAVLDVTERRAAMRYGQLLGSAIVGIAMGRDTTVIEANETFLDMIGRDRAELERGASPTAGCAGRALEQGAVCVMVSDGVLERRGESIDMGIDRVRALDTPSWDDLTIMVIARR